MPDRRATDAEARALASAVRLRILRLCLDEALTNQQVAERLGMQPASVLHHVRMLVDTGFLVAEPVRRGPRGSRERPYRSTGKSWRLDTPSATPVLVEAFLEEVAGAPAEDVSSWRLGLRLDDDERAELGRRLHEVLAEFADRPPTEGGRPWSVFLAVHPDAQRERRAEPAADGPASVRVVGGDGTDAASPRP